MSSENEWSLESISAVETSAGQVGAASALIKKNSKACEEGKKQNKSQLMANDHPGSGFPQTFQRRLLQV